jgi:hypothetical protein
MPFGLVFRKAVLWHRGKTYEFHDLQEIRNDPSQLVWNFRCSTKQGIILEANINGSGECLHHLPYLKTDCTGSFEVRNNSLAKARLRLQLPDRATEMLETDIGAVLEMSGPPP